jgi:hypothetical protein
MRHLSLLLIPALLTGTVTLCGCTDPYSRPGTWHAIGANDDNLRASVVNPGDLDWGQSEPGIHDGQLAAVAVLRLRTGQVKSLDSESISKIGGSGSAAGQSAPVTQGAGGS